MKKETFEEKVYKLAKKEKVKRYLLVNIDKKVVSVSSLNLCGHDYQEVAKTIIKNGKDLIKEEK